MAHSHVQVAILQGGSKRPHQPHPFPVMARIPQPDCLTVALGASKRATLLAAVDKCIRYQLATFSLAAEKIQKAHLYSFAAS